jgi:hypothetical protein
MNVLVLLALAFPLGCLALLSAIALFGVLLLAAPWGWRNRDALENDWHGDEPI